MTVKRGQPKTVVGTVTRNTMQKTIVVEVPRTVQHPLYGKFMRRVQVLKAHDESNEARVGAKVRLMATRPLSKTKRWRLVEIIEQGPEE